MLEYSSVLCAGVETITVSRDVVVVHIIKEVIKIKLDISRAYFDVMHAMGFRCSKPYHRYFVQRLLIASPVNQYKNRMLEFQKMLLPRILHNAVNLVTIEFWKYHLRLRRANQ